MATDTRLEISIADNAGIRDAPFVATWKNIFNLIDAAIDYEREACAKKLDALGGKAMEQAAAIVRSNAEITGRQKRSF